jgi:hypothetical protein
VTETLIATRVEILVVTLPNLPATLADLTTATATLDRLSANCWRLNVAVDAALQGGVPSPAFDPIPKTAPSLRIKRFAEGSLILELMEDPRIVAATGSLLGGGGLWMLCRVLRRGPRTVAQFLAEMTELPEAYRGHRAEIRTDSYRRQADEVDARLEMLDARLKEWYGGVAAEQIWTDYQQLLNVGGHVEARMIDADGNEIPEPPTVRP